MHEEVNAKPLTASNFVHSKFIPGFGPPHMAIHSVQASASPKAHWEGRNLNRRQILSRLCGHGGK
jgi:hypothetical protein